MGNRRGQPTATLLGQLRVFLRAESGQTASEYLGMLTVIAAIVAVLAASTIVQMSRTYVGAVVCDVLENPSCGEASSGAPGAGGGPRSAAAPVGRTPPTQPAGVGERAPEPRGGLLPDLRDTVGEALGATGRALDRAGTAAAEAGRGALDAIIFVDDPGSAQPTPVPQPPPGPAASSPAGQPQPQPSLGAAFVDGLLRGDLNRQGYAAAGHELARGAGQLLSSVLILGDIRDAGVAVDRLVGSGGRGGWGDLILAAAGFVPIAGDLAKGAKGAARSLDAADDAADLVRLAPNQLPPPRAVPRHVVVNALTGYQSRQYVFGSESFQLDKSGLKHILERHHRDYWNGTVAGDTQTFFEPDMRVDDVVHTVGQVLRQNRETLMERGANDVYQVRGRVNDLEYVAGVRFGRVDQFYPVPTLP